MVPKLNWHGWRREDEVDGENEKVFLTQRERSYLEIGEEVNHDVTNTD